MHPVGSIFKVHVSVMRIHVHLTFLVYRDTRRRLDDSCDLSHRAEDRVQPCLAVPLRHLRLDFIVELLCFVKTSNETAKRERQNVGKFAALRLRRVRMVDMAHGSVIGCSDRLIKID